MEPWLAWRWRMLRAQLVVAGYWWRPFDMLADRRHWRWQPPTPCGLRGVSPELRAQLVAAAARYLDSKDTPRDERPRGRPGA